MTDLVGGHIDLLSNSASIVGPLDFAAARCARWAWGGLQRVANLPEVPTLDEQGPHRLRETWSGPASLRRRDCRSRC